MKVKAELLILCSADQILQATSWLRLDCLLLWLCRSYNIKCQWSGKQTHFRNRCLWCPFAQAMHSQLESHSGIIFMHQRYICVMTLTSFLMKKDVNQMGPFAFKQSAPLRCGNWLLGRQEIQLTCASCFFPASLQLGLKEVVVLIMIMVMMKNPPTFPQLNLYPHPPRWLLTYIKT